MEKPAQEATIFAASIFALGGLLVATVGMVVKLEAEARAIARAEAAEAVHAQENRGGGMEATSAIAVVTLEDGTLLHVRQCAKFDPKTAYESVDRMMAALERRARHAGAAQSNEAAGARNEAASSSREPAGAAAAKADESLDCRNFSSTPADRALLERDYWAAYRESKEEALARNARGSLALGLFGLPAGLGVWILYRRVRVGGVATRA